jgi:hypothetical protein
MALASANVALAELTVFVLEAVVYGATAMAEARGID